MSKLLRSTGKMRIVSRFPLPRGKAATKLVSGTRSTASHFFLKPFAGCSGTRLYLRSGKGCALLGRMGKTKSNGAMNEPRYLVSYLS